jgi:hypothetical protein
MPYWLRDKLTIHLDGGQIADEDEHDASRLERMFALMGKVAGKVARHANVRFGLQTVCAIEEIIVNGDSLTVSWRKHDFMVSCASFVDSAWREIAGPAASVIHKINSEIVTPVAPAPGSFGASSYGNASYGGVATEELSQRGA